MVDDCAEEVRAQSQNYVCRANTFPATQPVQLGDALGALSTGEGKSLLLLRV